MGNSSEQLVYQVSDLTGEVRLLLESSYPSIRVEGEISNLARPRSGHLYFTLKDSKSQVRCAFFRNQMARLRCEPADGLRVRVRARVSLYTDRGDFQLVVSAMEKAGEGDLQAAFERLKQKLLAEGLFDNRHKQPLPRFPASIGVITSATGAAIQDIISTCQRRYPAASLRIYPVRVQGEGAVLDIARALEQADEEAICNVLIVGRGGGSLEDLQAYNDERLARAVFACRTPVISAVGHETDFTICDFVADQRAPTPTGAAEMATPDGRQLASQFRQFDSRLYSAMRNRLIHSIQRTDLLARRLAHPAQKLQSRRQLNAQLSERLRTGMYNRLGQCRQKLNHAVRVLGIYSPAHSLALREKGRAALEKRISDETGQMLIRCSIKADTLHDKLLAISPQATLDRGYAIASIFPEMSIVRSVDQARPGTQIEVRVADGRFTAKTE